jgi:hypothetical protein
VSPSTPQTMLMRFLPAVVLAVLKVPRDAILEAVQAMFYFHEKPPRAALLMSSDIDIEHGNNVELFGDANHFNEVAVELSLHLFDSMTPQLQHLSLPSLSWGKSIRHMCGFEREGFWKLFTFLRPAFSSAFPHSCHTHEDLKPTAKTSTLAFRLFVVLFILRTGATLRMCSVVFGWSHSVIHNWFVDISDIMHRKLALFRAFPNAQEQAAMALEHLAWVTGKLGDTTLGMYHTRLNFANAVGEIDRVFTGAFAAIDGTYALCPRFPSDIQEQMYTGYKKFHAYKLMVMCSLFTKAILRIKIGPARVADSLAYALDLDFIAQITQPLLGDDAFHGFSAIIAPFTKAMIAAVRAVRPATADAMNQFNSDHSSNRMSSEHAIGKLKEWAWVRGTDKYSRFHDHGGFVRGVEIVHSLVNADNCDFEPAHLFTSLRHE